jgi:hypothetical protein
MRIRCWLNVPAHAKQERRKAKRWDGQSELASRATQSNQPVEPGRPGQGSQIEPGRASQGAHGSQIEPGRASQGPQGSQIEPAWASQGAQGSQIEPWLRRAFKLGKLASFLRQYRACLNYRRPWGNSNELGMVARYADMVGEWKFTQRLPDNNPRGASYSSYERLEFQGIYGHWAGYSSQCRVDLSAAGLVVGYGYDLIMVVVLLRWVLELGTLRFGGCTCGVLLAGCVAGLFKGFF